MSMRGQIISREYNRMVFVDDKDGKEYACYIDDIQNLKEGEALNEQQKARCLDTSQVLGDSW